MCSVVRQGHNTQCQETLPLYRWEDCMWSGPEASRSLPGTQEWAEVWIHLVCLIPVPFLCAEMLRGSWPAPPHCVCPLPLQHIANHTLWYFHPSFNTHSLLLLPQLFFEGRALLCLFKRGLVFDLKMTESEHCLIPTSLKAGTKRSVFKGHQEFFPKHRRISSSPACLLINSRCQHVWAGTHRKLDAY